MIYQYQAANYCGSCGRAIMRELDEKKIEDDGDSETYPQGFANGNETDSVEHCASEDKCEEAILLSRYGLLDTDELKGAETRAVGEVLTDSLTSDGVNATRKMLARPAKTKYQAALHQLWLGLFPECEPAIEVPEGLDQYLSDDLDSDRFSVACALFWFCALNYAGQNSARYRILSESDYSPGAMETGPEEDSIDELIYEDLESGALDAEELAEWLKRTRTT